MARFSDSYRPREPLQRRESGLDHLTLSQVGLGPSVQVVLFFLSLFPFAGITMGIYYANYELHFGTRTFGRTMLAFSIMLNMVYFCVLCPLSFYLTLG